MYICVCVCKDADHDAKLMLDEFVVDPNYTKYMRSLYNPHRCDANRSMCDCDEEDKARLLQCDAG